MAELEIHHEHGPESDPMGKRVGILAAVLAVFLALVTIESHRAHTAGILLKTEANDQWSFYQAKSIKSHNLELGRDLIGLLAARGDSDALKKLEAYKASVERYAEETKEISEHAKEKEKEAMHAEHQALRFDFGEGLLEIGLVLSSLYFIARRTLFPIVGIIAGLAGIIAGVAGLMVQ
ncbi:MAG TPA: DUF4337 domain-containing protein [Bryobacteraceae bacterium]|jgi:hypothetical protein|nr:DUF4337 domain-containing protein [Bryobacteraceae bacterium]